MLAISSSDKIGTIRNLLQLLSDGGLHSGDSLGKTLGITRSAVWKQIKNLRERMGLSIDSKMKEGYRLKEPLELLDKQQIQTHLSPFYHPYLSKSLIFDIIDSTNSYLLSQNKDSEHCICMAEMQTAGRGRSNRSWLSPFGNNIYLSILWHFLEDARGLMGLSLAIGVAVVRALKQYGIEEEIQIKWPNDLYWKGCKLGGILVELRNEIKDCSDAVIGVGLNLCIPQALKETVSYPITDLKEITNSDEKKSLNRNKIMAYLLEQLLSALTLFQEQGLKPFIEEFRVLDHTFNKPVKMLVADQTFYGISRSINEQGFLLVEDEKGKIQIFSGGEASLRMDHIKCQLTLPMRTLNLN